MQVVGLILVALGLAFVLFVLALLRLLATRRKETRQASPVPVDPGSTSGHDEAVLLVQVGGRLLYLNQTARQWFKSPQEIPHLERLARQARPAEAFIGLCAAQGRARFILGEQAVEGVSYSLPYAGGRATLVTLRRPALLGEAAEGSTRSPDTGGFSRALDTYAELSAAIATSLDLETTLETILTSLTRLIPAEFAEIHVWDRAHQYLVPYRLVQTPEHGTYLEKGHQRNTLETGYAGYLAKNRQPLYVPDVDTFTPVEQDATQPPDPFRCLIGVPLEVTGNLVGALLLGRLNVAAYSPDDVETLRFLARPAAIAVNNALLYDTEQRRVLELSGLANLSQATATLNDPEELYYQLVESIKPLLEVEFLGFLVYDENRHQLQGQNPFHGLRANLIEWTRVPLPADSPAEKIWLAGKPVLTSDAPREADVQALGLHHLAQAAGIQHLMLVPLSSSGRNLGYLMAGDRLDGSPFEQGDQRLLATISGQVAPLIENARLFQESRRRAQRAETLRRIASLTSSLASLEEILKFALQDLARLLAADYAAIFLVDERRGELRLNKDSLFGVDPDLAATWGRLSMDDPQFRYTVTGSRKAYFGEDVLEDQRVLPVYRPITVGLDIHSAIVVPLVTRERGIGELMLGSRQAAFFSRGDFQTVTTAAGQLASAIEQASLYTQTDESLQRRVLQMTALTRISRELNVTYDLEHLLQRVFDEALQTTQADCGTIMLFELSQAALLPEDGEKPRIALFLGDPPGETLHPLEQAVLADGESRVVTDFEQTTDPPDRREPGRPAPPPAHAGVRSALIVPIAYQERVAGLIHLHARRADCFDAAATDIAEALAVQAAIALSNAHRYQELSRRNELLNQRIDTLARLFEISQSLQIDQPLVASLENIAYAIQGATPFNTILISVYDGENELYRVEGAAGVSLVELETLKSSPPTQESIDELLQDDFRLGRAYFLPHAQLPDAELESRSEEPAPANGNLGATQEDQGWQAGDLLIVPLENNDGEPLGLVSVGSPGDNLRPNYTTIETLEIFCSQAALVIEGHRKLSRLASRLDRTQQELEQQQSTAREVTRQLPQLSAREAENAIHIQRLSQQVHRLSAGMDIAETVNRQTSRPGVLKTLGSELLRLMGFDTVLIAEPGAHGPVLLFALGAMPEGANLDALLGQRNPLTHCLLNGEQVLIDHLETETNWAGSPLLQALESKALICLPIMTATGSHAAVLASRREPLPPFGPEEAQLFGLLASQMAIRLQNLNLLDETSGRLGEVNLLLDFSQRLGSLNPADTLHTLAETAFNVAPGAQASMVAIWDARQNALLTQAAVGYPQPERLMEISYRAGEALPGQCYATGQVLRLGEVDFARAYNLPAEDLLRYRDATGGRLPVSTLAVPIRRGPEGETMGVVVLDNYQVNGAFNAESQALIESLAQQTALSLENARLYQSARQRTAQLQALTRAGAAMTAKLEPDELLASLLDLLGTVLPYDTGTLWLRIGPQAVIKDTRGFADEEQRAGLATAVEDSALLSEMIATRQPLYAADIRQDGRFPSLLEPTHLSWLGVPLVAGGEVTGVIALEKREAGFYDPEDIQIAATFAGQAAVAIENARLFQESQSRSAQLDQRSRRLELLNRHSAALGETLDMGQILATTCQTLQETLAAASVSAVLIQAGKEAQLHTRYPEPSPDVPPPIPYPPLFDRLHQTLGVFNTDDFHQEAELQPLFPYLEEAGGGGLLILPLATASDLHGLILVSAGQMVRATPDEAGLARTIANQAAIALQNARLYAETRSWSEELEKRVQARTAELEKEHQRSQILLRVITELSSSLDLEQVLNRTLRLVNEVVDAGQITVLIARPGESKLHRLASLGYATPTTYGGEPTPFDQNQGLAGWVLTRQEATLIADVRQDPRWILLSDAPEPHHRSAMAVPLMVGAEALGVLMLYHSDVDHFSSDQLDLVQAAANQIAIGINNAELYRLIRDQAEDLGNMFRSQQIEASRSRAILEAVADGVLVTDAQRMVTLFNKPAAQMLRLEQAEVIGRSLEHFSGLFGRAARPWMETIRAWSENPGLYQSGDSYTEQITLEDGRVVSVSLAPVSLKDDFLGTVSVFRDVTHLVELDRLKSEFVATVSHELRTPMTSIKGYTEILLLGAAGKLNEQQDHFLNIVKENTERLSILVDDLLDISRIETGRVALSLQPLDLREVVQGAITDLQERSRQEGKPMKVTAEQPASLPLVLADRERVRQIVENLLENAYYYTAENGHIAVSFHPSPGEVRIDVRDTGIGIPPELQPHVFERFYRGEHPFVLATSGTGLGLSIVHHLVEMHRGRIWLQSSGVAGEGSTFSFTVPLFIPEEG